MKRLGILLSIFLAALFCGAEDKHIDDPLLASIVLQGISPGFPPSCLAERKVDIPPQSLFYIGKSPVAGILAIHANKANAILAKELADGKWLKNIVFRGLYCDQGEKMPPASISNQEVLLEWDKPICHSSNDGQLDCTIKFSLRLRSGQELEPGIYTLRRIGLDKLASFSMEEVDRLNFVVSRFETKNDQLNWHEAVGDSYLKRAMTVDALTDLRSEKKLALFKIAVDAYQEFLSLSADDDRVLLKQAYVFELMGDNKQAALTYKKVLKLWETRQGLVRVAGWERLNTREDKWQDFHRAVTERVKKLSPDLPK